MFSRALCIHKGGLTNIPALRLLGAAYVQRTKTTTAVETTDVTTTLNIQDAAAVAEHRKKFEMMLKEDLPKPYDGPERDHVNFPRRVRAIEQGKVRLGFLPDEWFTFFYKKTGVTGPYVFGVGLLTFLCSKEWYVFEDEFSTGCALFFIIYVAIKKYGDPVRKYRDDTVAKELGELNQQKQGHMDDLVASIEGQNKYVWQSEGQKILMEAKRENVQMQLETEYRRRMMNVYEQVKNRLDYQLEYLNTKRKLEQKHMVDWMVSNVVKSITPQQEKEALQKCIEDLKLMSTQAH